MSRSPDEAHRIQRWRRIRKKLHYVLAIVLLAGGVLWITHEYVVTAALSTYARIDMHPKQAAALAHTLEEREITTAAASSSQFMLGNYRFAVPTEMSVERQISDKRIILRGSGTSATIGIDAGDRLQVAEEIDRRSMPVDEIFPYGELTKEAFFGRIARASPEHISLLSSAREQAQETVLLALKASIVPDSISGASTVVGDSITGYQFGDPAQDTHVVVHAFTGEGSHFSIGVDGFSQSQIDSFLASIAQRASTTTHK